MKGLTAAVVGKSVNEHVAIFGGKSSEGGCDDLWLFTPLSAEQLTIFSRAPVVEGEDGEAEGEEPLEPPTPWIKLTVRKMRRSLARGTCIRAYLLGQTKIFSSSMAARTKLLIFSVMCGCAIFLK